VLDLKGALGGKAVIRDGGYEGHVQRHLGVEHSVIVFLPKFKPELEFVLPFRFADEIEEIMQQLYRIISSGFDPGRTQQGHIDARQIFFL
jgi:hypothetical protein